ncbi:MAG TPA: hypothetical protein VHO07_30040 [Streptosporangiaceae bacterium]|jgi:hypothetical protein|nr:hypothetical protein [Streptosporangiaceae bacterium]
MLTGGRGELAGLLAASGFDVLAHQYQFRTRWAQQMYLSRSAYGGKAGFGPRRAGFGPRPGRGEVLIDDSAQGVGFIIDGTSTKACRGRAVDACSALSACPGDPGEEQVRSWHLAY